MVLLVINLYTTLMMTPFIPPDHVCNGLAKLGETETDAVPWKKTRRREASTCSEKMPNTSGQSDVSTMYLALHSSDQTVLCTAGLLFRLIGGISAMFHYWCRYRYRKDGG